MLAPTRTVAPEEKPVSIAEAKLHLRVDHSEDDTLIDGFIAAATEHLDGWAGILGRVLVTQTWTQKFGGFCSKLRLPLGPVSTVATITYFDSENSMQTLPDTDYSVLTNAAGTYVIPAIGVSWPATFARADAVTATYVAGASIADVPAPIRTAILLMVANWYENREAATVNEFSELPFGARVLLAPYRRIGL